MKQREPVLAEVACAAGVFTMTVSNVLNDRPGASVATRRRVRAAADRLGYSPRLAAQSLAKGRISRVGLLLDDLTVPYATERVSGVSDELAERGCEQLITGYLPGRFAGGSQDPASCPGRVDALILVAPLLGDQTTEVLACCSIPVVVVDPRQLSDCGYPTIVVDNYRGARSGTDHLLRIGHGRLGFVGGDPSFDSAKQRKRGHLESVSLSSADSGTHRWRNAVW